MQVREATRPAAYVMDFDCFIELLPVCACKQVNRTESTLACVEVVSYILCDIATGIDWLSINSRFHNSSTLMYL